MAPPKKTAADKTAADTTVDGAQDAAAYQPVGQVKTLAEAKRDGKTIRVLQDDVRVWKEEA